MLVHHPHGHEVDAHEHDAEGAHPAHHHVLVGQEEPEAHKCQQHDSQRSAKYLLGLNLAEKAGATVESIEHREDEQVEDAAAEHIAHGQVGVAVDACGADAHEELGQGSDGGHEHEAKPSAAQAGDLGEAVAEAGQAGAAEGDGQGASGESEEGPEHACKIDASGADSTARARRTELHPEPGATNGRQHRSTPPAMDCTSKGLLIAYGLSPALRLGESI